MLIIKIIAKVSNRHIHLTKEDYYHLFREEISKRNDLTQPGEYASNQTVTIKGPKRSIENVRVLGPFRETTQVEVSKTDCYTLGIDAPVRISPDLEDAALVTIIGEVGEITKNAAIIAARHIHITPDKQKELNLYEDQVSIKINNAKGGILENVYIRSSDKYAYELHLDTDDANSMLINQDDELEIIK